MKNNKVLGVFLTASFCASTMMACGVYGAPEDYEERKVIETEETDSVISSEKENYGADTVYYPDKEEDISVYGPPEYFQ